RRGLALEPMDGVVPYPPGLAARYRERGYWRDRTLDQVFGPLFERHRDRAALLYREQVITYEDLGRRRAALAGRLHGELGLRPRDRVVVHLPNLPEFIYLYFALQRIGAIPILALAPHRRLEIEHFVRLADAVAYFGVDPDLGRDIQGDNPGLRHVLGLDDLTRDGDAEEPPAPTIDPCDPCCLLL